MFNNQKEIVVLQIKEYPEYCFEKKKLMNTQRGREVKMCLNNYTRGYYLRGKFVSFDRIKKMLIVPEIIECPF